MREAAVSFLSWTTIVLWVTLSISARSADGRRPGFPFVGGCRKCLMGGEAVGGQHPYPCAWVGEWNLISGE